MPKKVSITLTWIFLFSPLVLGQSAGVYVDIGPCMNMESDEERYACYDLLEEQIRAAELRNTELPRVSIQRNTRNQTTPDSDRTSQSESRLNDTNGSESTEEFGLQPPSVTNEQLTNARILENEDGEQELMDTIVKLDSKVLNQWEISLAGGQVWHQINSKRYRLLEGMEVRIYPSPFGGSFRLTATNLNGFIQVRRIK